MHIFVSDPLKWLSISVTTTTNASAHSHSRVTGVHAFLLTIPCNYATMTRRIYLLPVAWEWHSQMEYIVIHRRLNVVHRLHDFLKKFTNGQCDIPYLLTLLCVPWNIPRISIFYCCICAMRVKTFLRSRQQPFHSLFVWSQFLSSLFLLGNRLIWMNVTERIRFSQTTIEFIASLIKRAWNDWEIRYDGDGACPQCSYQHLHTQIAVDKLVYQRRMNHFDIDNYAIRHNLFGFLFR